VASTGSDKNTATVFKQIDATSLRSMYIRYFEERAHAAIPSASLVPENDPSVLFTTAGMHPLVPYLLGRAHPAGDRLVNYQKCVRTTDIDEVGDNSHLTFFEMLGNWSLGSYFKEESLTWSFDFLTNPDLLGIPVDRIWATVFEGSEGVPRDEESAAIWRSLGLPPERIVYLGMEHNWWAVGSEGPCGPDSEIFIDITDGPCERGEECLPGLCDCGRFFEIWNNVFMTFERKGEELLELPKRNVDTGMGVERTVAVLNGVASVYEVPEVARVKEALAELREEPFLADEEEHEHSLRILTDHLRTSVFMLADPAAVVPSNQGRGYVLRRIIRRAVRHGHKLGLQSADWVAVANTVIEIYGEAYPELRHNSEKVLEELNKECDRFARTLHRGMAKLTKEVERLHAAGETQISGEMAFHLYDTDGFPLEFTEEVAAESGLSVDVDGFEGRFAQHRELSKTTSATSGLADQSEQSIRYHTATHLLHAALREVLGEHVRQQGSNITQERMRFDFSHTTAMTPEEIQRVEQLVQEQIDRGIEVERFVMGQDQARQMGAIGLFDDKYSGEVSVYKIDDFSTEFCAGPHVKNTRELGHFHIVKEQSSGAGVRRIRAQLD
jgi:alanyl-tRNA synthetase